MNPLASLDHYHILTAMLAPALLMAATGSLLISANNRLARVVDRLRSIMARLRSADAQARLALESQVARHRRRAQLVLRACQMAYVGLGCFIGTSLALAVDAFSGFRLSLLPTALAVLGVLSLLVASICMSREVGLAVRSFDHELDMELDRHPD
ncbi:MAG TPA: DUF2721 domain-containing protein [Arenimonas sp.]|nr:DUF2721 domain-containing protein [Arenimonas sp.]